MTELTREDMSQIKEALKTAINALQNRVGRVAEAEMKELKDAFQLLDAALYPMPAVPAAKVETAPVAAKAKTVKLSAAQRKLLRTICMATDNNFRKSWERWGRGFRQETLDHLVGGKLIVATEENRFAITEAGRAALNS